MRLTTILLLPASSILLLTAFTKSSLSIRDVQAAYKIQNAIDTVPEDGIFEKVEVEAYFPGGENGWFEYLQKNLNPALPVDNGAPAGTYTVMIQFVVDVNGKLSEFKALTKHGFGMEQEVLRILRKSPSWIPAMQDGNKVKAYRKQPVTFQIVDEKKKKRRS